MSTQTTPAIQLISGALFDSVTALASASQRRRMNHNFHSGAGDNPHRFLNVLMLGTYIRPHRHSVPPKTESFVVLEGAADVIIFDEPGVPTNRYRLGTETQDGRLWGIDIASGIWHTIVARSPRAVCFEVKPGPWEPGSDKEFADWAPAEADPSAAEFLEALQKRVDNNGL
jgi:cupin fold WbuC family metalloprotein